MLTYVAFDDTDTVDADRGTGRLARDYAARLPSGCRLRGVVRQQLPRLEGIPYTANNSAACVIVETEGEDRCQELVTRGADHIREYFIEGSDPGLCVAAPEGEVVDRLIAFGRVCCHRRVTQAEAMAAAEGIHLSGHGGTNDGIIGAAASVGLTLYGWSGRYIELGDLRAYPEDVAVSELEKAGMRVVPVDRDAVVPWLDHVVETAGWLRPRLWGGEAVVPVRQAGDGRWQIVGARRAGRGR